jgi:prepilin-type N-terminal cleavage/methylation domain-containing protein
MRRKIHGFTMLEVMVVVVIIGILATLTVQYGRSAKQAGDLASVAWELSIRASALRARAMSANKDFVLVLVDTADPAGCQSDLMKCGKAVVFSSPKPTFAISGFNPDPPYATVDYEEELRLPRNSQFDTTSVWTAPAPFASVTAMDSGILTTCTGGRKCFALRFRLDGLVEPVLPGAALTPPRAGFAFLLRPVFGESGAAERRALFVSFPTGIVKTAVF